MSARFNIEFDLDMWIVVPDEEGPYGTQESAQEECNKRNTSLGWSGAIVGDDDEWSEA